MPLGNANCIVNNSKSASDERGAEEIIASSAICVCLATQFEALLLPLLLLLLLLFLLNVSGFGKIVVVGKAFFSNASSGGVVVG